MTSINSSKIGREILDSEKAADTILRLERARARGEISYIEAIFEGEPGTIGNVVVFVHPESGKDNLEEIESICMQEGDIECCPIDVVPELCLEGEPVAPSAGKEILTTLEALIAQIGEAPIGVVHPVLWAIRYSERPLSLVSLQISFRGESTDMQQITVACQLAKLLNRNLRVTIRGQSIDIEPNSNPDEVCTQIYPIPEPVLPGIMKELGERLQVMATAALNWVPGQPLPEDAIIYSDGGDNTPPKSIRFGADNDALNVVYRYNLASDGDEKQGE